jgi:flavodoxin
MQVKTAIIYYSKHHGNTKKLLDQIATQSDITLIDASTTLYADLSGYDLIGFASGTDFSKLHQNVIEFAERNLPMEKKVFVISTYGGVKPRIHNLKKIISLRNGQFVGHYGCKGYDTYGLFKIIGGIAKGRPNAKDVARAVKFFNNLVERYGG